MALEVSPAAPIAAPVPIEDEAPITSKSFPLPRCLQHPAAAGEPELITQGAEGRLYRTSHLAPGVACALKYRPPKPYRHPLLDARLTRHRILSEARILQKCRREGVAVPALYTIDEAAGTLAMEWVPGEPVRVGVNRWLAERRRRYVAAAAAADGNGNGTTAELDGEVVRDEEGAADLVGLMRRVGAAVGRLHKAGIIHGDLTTSNMMLRPWSEDRHPSGNVLAGLQGEAARPASLEGEIVIIDFGLASQGTADEDRAVDLYVLERAFASTHPRAEGLFSVVLEGYREIFKAAPVVLKKLEDVRLRGRKRSMLG
ncbi:kinase-like domain-containing protein [Xylariales sp. PMI_506]|nr:kinase-like domain-containing protein [Xylariales sp. PMI_506]